MRYRDQNLKWSEWSEPAEFTQQVLAEKVSVSRQMIIAIEKGGI